MLLITKNQPIFCLLILQLFIAGKDGFGQKQANHWFFGQMAGLDFNSGSPVVVPGSLISVGGGAKRKGGW